MGGGSENFVGKCYQPGCLRRAAQKCRGCLQVGLAEAASAYSTKGGSENFVGKCYQPGCLRRAAHKCRGCVQQGVPGTCLGTAPQGRVCSACSSAARLSLRSNAK